MTTSPVKSGYRLPVNTEHSRGVLAHGFVTPSQDTIPQVQSIPPRRVLPIVFIPGIMGSNLRLTGDRQSILHLDNNIAWRPDNSTVTLLQYNDEPIERQLRLDPSCTEVDTYDPLGKSTGDPKETIDQRNENVVYKKGYRPDERSGGPLLQSDPVGAKNRRTQDQKARERGWGEIFFGSYQEVLSLCERSLNSAFSGGVMDPFLQKNVANIDPSKWNALSAPVLEKLDEETMRGAVKGCWFPVHAMGYNWLQGNSDSGIRVAERIVSLIDSYNKKGFECEKVILVTHSMGGLVARAVIHPKIGKINDRILGIIHGVMPAVGAAAAYKRMRCGVETSSINPLTNITARILGNNSKNVTAVLADAQGALELLPSRFYGKNWLEAKKGRSVIKSWPTSCPYDEIYMVRGKWFSLFNEEWINPGKLKGRGMSNTITLLRRARRFHEQIFETYHDNSYAHYCVDPERKAWQKVVWEIEDVAPVADVTALEIVTDDNQGRLQLGDPEMADAVATTLFRVKMVAAADPGDETVPANSSDAQNRSGKFKGIFRQTGYEHQASYGDPKVLAATLYCLFKIISEMKWSKP